MKTALLTRPEGEAAEASKARLAALGWAALHEAMTRIEALPNTEAPLPPDWLARAQALAFTSRNGVEIFSRRSPFRDAPVYAVGAATAASARTAGFLQVESADGDGAALARLLAARLDSRGGPLLHLSGEEKAVNIATLLNAAGYPAENRVLYRNAARESLSPAAVAALEARRIDSILIYAPGAARALARLLERRFDLSNALIAAISPAAAEPLRGAGAGRVLAAERPDESSLFALLAQASGAR